MKMADEEWPFGSCKTNANSEQFNGFFKIKRQKEIIGFVLCLRLLIVDLKLELNGIYFKGKVRVNKHRVERRDKMFVVISYS